MTAKRSISSDEFDRIFDENEEDIMDYLDLDASLVISNPKCDVKRVNVDFPLWMVEGLDRQAGLLAINRQAVIKTWIADRLKAEQV